MCTVLYCTVLYCTALYCTVLYCTVLYCTVLYCTVLYCTVLCCTVLYCTVLYCTVLYCTVLYCAILCYTVLYSTVLCYTVLYCTVLYCTVLYYCHLVSTRWQLTNISVSWISILRKASIRYVLTITNQPHVLIHSFKARCNIILSCRPYISSSGSFPPKQSTHTWPIMDRTELYMFCTLTNDTTI